MGTAAAKAATERPGVLALVLDVGVRVDWEVVVSGWGGRRVCCRFVVAENRLSGADKSRGGSGGGLGWG